MRDAPIDSRRFPPDPRSVTLSEPASGIDVEKPINLDTAGGIVTTRVGRWENSNRNASATGAESAAVAELRMRRNMSKRLRACGQLYWRIPTDHCDEGRIFWVIKLKRQRVAVPREGYVLNQANFDVVWEWRGSSGYDKQAVGRLTGSLDCYGGILTLTGLGGEFPGIRVGKEGKKEGYDGYLHGSGQPDAWSSTIASAGSRLDSNWSFGCGSRAIDINLFDALIRFTTTTTSNDNDRSLPTPNLL